MYYLLLLVIASLQGLQGMDSDADDFDMMFNEPVDRSHWVDPHSMGLEEVSEFKHSCDFHCNPIQNKLDTILRDLTECRKLFSSEKEEAKCEPKYSKQCSEQIFYRRHVTVLLYKLGLLGDPENSHLSAEIYLSAEDVNILQRFRDETSFDVRDVDSVLSTMILGSQPFKTKPNQYWANIKEIVHEVKEPLLLLCAAVVVAHLVLATFRYFPLWKIVLAICLVSVFWHWVHMYKTAWATKKSNLFKLQDVPKECRPGEMSWFQTIESFAKSTVSNTDRCQEYHKALLVDPIYEVSPMMAAADLATNLLLRPLRIFGKEAGHMFSGLLETVPTVWKVPVLLLFMVMLLFLMILTAGYRIRLPFMLGEIGPAMAVSDSRLTHQQAVTEIKMVLQTDNPRQPLQVQSQKILQHKVLEETCLDNYSIQALDTQTSQVETIPLERQTSGVKTVYFEKQALRMETQTIEPKPLELRAHLEKQLSMEKDVASLIKTNSVHNLPLTPTKNKDRILHDNESSPRRIVSVSGQRLVASTERRNSGEEPDGSGANMMTTAQKMFSSNLTSVDELLVGSSKLGEAKDPSSESWGKITSLERKASFGDSSKLFTQILEEQEALDLRTRVEPIKSPASNDDSYDDDSSGSDGAASLLTSPQSKAFLSKVFQVLETSDTDQSELL